MNVLKKFAVSLTALTTLATLGIGSFSVSANELTKVNTNLLSDTATAEDKFIASYKNADEAAAAKYYIDNGISVAEAKEMMDIYLDGKAEVNASKNSMVRTSGVNMNRNFYNGTYLSRNQHYGIVIANDGAANVSTSLKISYAPAWVSVANGSANPIGDILNWEESYLSSSVRLEGDIYPPANAEDYIPVAIADMPFNVIMTSAGAAEEDENYAESTLYNKFNLTVSYCDALGDRDTTFTYETYIAGDVDHDGRVTTKDSYYITNILSGTTDGYTFTYTDKSSNIAKIVNDRAMDTDRNGEIGLADVTMIRNMIE